MARGFTGSLIVIFHSLLFLPWSWAVNYQPWLGNVYEFEWQNDLIYQNFSKVASNSQLKKYSSNDFFLSSRLSNSKDNYSLEGGFTLARTRKQMWDVDHLILTGKYVWWDDVAGDPLTLTTGLTLSECFVPALRDLSSFHHGRGEAELFISLGAETEQNGTLWLAKRWGVASIGISERGSPWLRGQLVYEFRLCTYHELGFQLLTLWGLGRERLRPHDFHGYGSIRHQSADVGVKYTYLIPFIGKFSLEYYYRPYARNFPAQAHQAVLSFLCTFGL